MTARARPKSKILTRFSPANIWLKAPEKPTRLELDSLWDRYLLVVLLFFPFAGLAIWQILSFSTTPCKHVLAVRILLEDNEER